MKIENEIQQKNFRSEYEKLAVNILFTSSWLNNLQSNILKPYGITIQQFNILRILKGQKGSPATVKLLGERMIDKMSNASRLVDKLVLKGLVERSTSGKDRRQVDILITKKGKEVIDQISKEMDGIKEEMSNVSKEEAQKLNELLDQLRGK